MSINRLIMIVVVAGYLLVNIRMQVDFFAGRDIFEKYAEPASSGEAIHIAQQAYYAKTAFLLLLLLLSVCKVPFGLGFALSMSLYASLMVVFFGWHTITVVYVVAALALLLSYLFVRERSVTGKRLPKEPKPVQV